ncbi:MAG TPA: SMP-30/gluconolactonase/LRE family protein [Rheinheimera sp.]|uniref:SMP-30/gluconolactonase/LRE family protein n=1 Tax=Rheinheimera sp. TaxID=1869214 RepID=UPI002B48BAE2|nr:SMP-30/gluconolactonase/LRE family protein [Rheinheimera sp.]HJS16249.1 SMP-30/gluconolactonase/LRE family protein [Rheinheimera sp.]
MKACFPLLLCILPALITTTVLAEEAISSQPELEALWHTKDLRVPESVLWHQQQSNGKTDTLLFVSEIDGQGSAADAVGGLAVLNTDGTIRNKDWLRGLNAPKGLAVYQGKLYIADLTEVVIVDIASAKILQKIKAPDSVFLNDVTVDAKGGVYISDTRKNRIYKLEQDKISSWLENVEAANGLKVVAEQLYIAAGDKLLKVDLADHNKSITQVAVGFAERADGLEPVGNGDFIVSCWAGLVYYVSADGRIKELLDTKALKLNTADIGWDQTTNTLYIPTFLGNSVQAYKLSY